MTRGLTCHLDSHINQQVAVFAVISTEDVDKQRCHRFHWHVLSWHLCPLDLLSTDNRRWQRGKSARWSSRGRKWRKRLREWWRRSKKLPSSSNNSEIRSVLRQGNGAGANTLHQPIFGLIPIRVPVLKRIITPQSSSVPRPHPVSTNSHLSDFSCCSHARYTVYLIRSGWS